MQPAARLRSCKGWGAGDSEGPRSSRGTYAAAEELAGFDSVHDDTAEAGAGATLKAHATAYVTLAANCTAQTAASQAQE